MGRGRHETCKQNKGLKSRRSRGTSLTGQAAFGRRNSKINDGYKRKILNSIKIDEENSKKVAIVLRKLDGILVAGKLSSLTISASTPSNEPPSSRNGPAAAAHTPPNTCWNDLRSPLAPGRITFFPLIVDHRDDDESAFSSTESIESVDDSSKSASFVATGIPSSSTGRVNLKENSNRGGSSQRSNSFSYLSSIGQKMEGRNNDRFSGSLEIMQPRNSFPSSMPSSLQERSQRNRQNGNGGEDARGKFSKIFYPGTKLSQSADEYHNQHHCLNRNNRNMKLQELVDCDTKAHRPDNGRSREMEDGKYRSSE